MYGILGTNATLRSDLTLIFTVIFGIVAAVGAIHGRRRRFSKHCPVMTVGMLLNWIPILIVMIPNWLGVITSGSGGGIGATSLAPIGHGVLGGVTQVLMTYTVMRMQWFEDLPPKEPIWLMRITIVLWLLTVLGGIFVYLTLYVL
jgi:putative membrane protein